MSKRTRCECVRNTMIILLVPLVIGVIVSMIIFIESSHKNIDNVEDVCISRDISVSPAGCENDCMCEAFIHVANIASRSGIVSYNGTCEIGVEKITRCCVRYKVSDLGNDYDFKGISIDMDKCTEPSGWDQNIEWNTAGIIIICITPGIMLLVIICAGLYEVYEKCSTTVARWRANRNLERERLQRNQQVQLNALQQAEIDRRIKEEVAKYLVAANARAASSRSAYLPSAPPPYVEIAMH
jgi:hypothetical protein